VYARRGDFEAGGKWREISFANFITGSSLAKHLSMPMFSGRVKRVTCIKFLFKKFASDALSQNHDVLPWTTLLPKTKHHLQCRVSSPYQPAIATLDVSLYWPESRPRLAI